MVEQICDDYLLALDNLPEALKKSYSQIKSNSLSFSDFDYSRVVANRLRAFYCAQNEIKKFLGKQIAPAGADFFVETVLFCLRIFNDIEHLGLEILSERTVARRRKSIRPDITIWKEGKIIAVIECKTQLGWMRKNWHSHFDEREKQLSEAFPESEMFWFVMTSCNWDGFEKALEDGLTTEKKLLCFLNKIWPTQIPKEIPKDPEISIFLTPIENLLKEIKRLS
ncbi:hypothetical protein HNI00_16750 [Thermoleptolyngbya oregonensis NK1-22]|uniref:Restriction endonuclease type I HsdR N-terminal domain-containing protein n=1 Tax=Thermoleptolyngbya oregonensis NK1-22 TaxID=2547457 RepID=A0AA96Y5V5_9CYAN|nr:hypothetical protein HNI00_16750 [Thermoleptolyngbya oregonensis NK1-22]